MRKKSLKVLLGSISCCLLLVGSLSAESKELSKFTKNESGELGYDLTQLIPLYPGSSEIVDIPESYNPNKELFQSSWVATIQNLNFAQPANQEEFQTNYLNTLNDFKEWNMNAMIFQVRPLLDSWYPSEFNPWSQFLSGTQGVDPGYDPLSWMVEETHKKGMEYHAWLNPYRVSNVKFNNDLVKQNTGKTEEELVELSVPELIKLYNESGILADDNYAVLNPEEVLIFDQKLFLNPGIPEVRQHVYNTVNELVRNYDIDAIHFDDYFYPYRITVDGENVFFGNKNEDKATFEKYGEGYTSIDEWRRHNIDLLVEGVKETIDNANNDLGKSVQFGISPFGIWEHKENDERGANTPISSSQSYSGSIFADTYKWIKEETVDYMAPQIYWSFDQAAAPYGELAQWWNDVAEGTHTQIYVGHANYKHVGNGGWDASWLNPEEVPNQLRFNTLYNNIKGSALFSYNDIKPTNIDNLAENLKQRNEAKNKSIELLRTEYFNRLSLVPAKPWLSNGDNQPPKSVKLEQNELIIEPSENGTERFYIVYSGEGNTNDILSSSENIVDRIYNDGSSNFKVALPSNLKENIFVTTTDAAGVESDPYVVEKENTKGQVIIKYLDKSTNKEIERNSFEGEVGEAFTIELKTFEGYKVIQPDFSLEGKYTKDNQVFTIYYDAISSGNSSSDTNESSGNSSDSSSSTSESKGTTTSSSKAGVKGNTPSSKQNNSLKSLPKTGGKQGKLYLMMGVMLLTVCCAFLRKNIKNN